MGASYRASACAGFTHGRIQSVVFVSTLSQDIPTCLCKGGAPVSRVLVLATAGSSVLAQAVRAARRPMPPHVAAFEQAFVFRHPGELLFGVGLLYYFRCIVVAFGTIKDEITCNT